MKFGFKKMCAGLALLAGPAFAHDPYEITADARLRPETLTLTVTMARSTALAVARGEKEAPTFEPAQFAEHHAQFLAAAPAVLGVATTQGPLAPQRVDVGLGIEHDVEFRLTFARPPGGTLRLTAPHLAKLDAGYGDLVRVYGPNGETLADKLLNATDATLEFTVPAPPIPPAPARTFNYGAATAAVLVAFALLQWFGRRRRAPQTTWVTHAP